MVKTVLSERPDFVRSFGSNLNCVTCLSFLKKSSPLPVGGADGGHAMNASSQAEIRALRGEAWLSFAGGSA